MLIQILGSQKKLSARADTSQLILEQRCFVGLIFFVSGRADNFLWLPRIRTGSFL